MYDPLVGRFLEEDPLDFAAGDPDLYRYVKNSPTNATDPSGLEEKPSAPRFFARMSKQQDGQQVITFRDWLRAFAPEDQDKAVTYWNNLVGRDKNEFTSDWLARLLTEEYRNSQRSDLELLDSYFDALSGSDPKTAASATPPAAAGSASPKPLGGLGLTPATPTYKVRIEITGQIFDQVWWYRDLTKLTIPGFKKEKIGFVNPVCPYESDAEFKGLVDALAALTEKGKIEPPTRPGKPGYGAWYMSPNLTDEEVIAVAQVKNLLSPDAFVGLQKEANDLLVKIHRRMYEIRYPKDQRFGEGFVWGFVKTGDGIGQAMANPDKVVEGLRKLATDGKARQALLNEIEKKLKDDDAEVRGDLAFDITSFLSGAGAGIKTAGTVGKAAIKVTLTISKPTVQKLKAFLKGGGKLTGKEADELLNIHPDVWGETPGDRLAKLTEMPDAVPMAKRPGANPAAKSWDWEHILHNHSPNGRGAAQRNDPSQVFQGLTDEQIVAVCKRAWAERKKVETQQNLAHGTRIRYQGIDPETGRGVEFWFNLDELRVETAYPLPGG